jgi:hypothetical protein
MWSKFSHVFSIYIRDISVYKMPIYTPANIQVCLVNVLFSNNAGWFPFSARLKTIIIWMVVFATARRGSVTA